MGQLQKHSREMLIKTKTLNVFNPSFPLILNNTYIFNNVSVSFNAMTVEKKHIPFSPLYFFSWSFYFIKKKTYIQNVDMLDWTPYTCLRLFRQSDGDISRSSAFSKLLCEPAFKDCSTHNVHICPVAVLCWNDFDYTLYVHKRMIVCIWDNDHFNISGWCSLMIVSLSGDGFVNSKKMP